MRLLHPYFFRKQGRTQKRIEASTKVIRIKMKDFPMAKFENKKLDNIHKMK